MPEKMHMILISRTEPDLALPKYRIKWQMQTLDEMDLRFQEAEIQRFYHARGFSLDDGDINRIKAYTGLARLLWLLLHGSGERRSG
jgi:LuxR family maltose regulon positive regulatory protein